jgi:hypothetical protein
MPRLKKIKDFIRNSVLSHGMNSTVSEFVEEVRQHRPALERAYTRVLGKEKVDKVLEFDKNLFPSNSYLFDISSLKGDTALTCSISSREDILFNVMINLRGGDEFRIDSAGEIEADSEILSTFPFSPFVLKQLRNMPESSKRPVSLSTSPPGSMSIATS